MPIVEECLLDTVLSQGDILKGVSLFASAYGSSGYDASKLSPEMCLVLSRPCIAIREKYVCVATIDKYKGSLPKDVESLDDMIDFLEDVRNGTESPDVFYLGQLPGYEDSDRFCARLNLIHTIEIPVDSGNSSRRQCFVNERRICRLRTAFCHDLHHRLFRSYASLGFDDHAWFPTKDLEMVIERGERELTAATLKHQEVKTTQSRQEFNAGQFNSKDLTEAETKIGEIEKKLVPFKLELEKRTLQSNQADEQMLGKGSDVAG